MSAAPGWIAEAIRFGMDEESGAEVEQLTSEPVTSTNIYCEQRYTSADGHRIALSRAPFGQPMELWVCDLRSLRLQRIGQGNPIGANALRDAIYYVDGAGESPRLMRLNLKELTSEMLFSFGTSVMPKSGTVSPDERCFVGGPFPVREHLYSLHRIDMGSGRSETLCEIEDMFNPHVQFDPSTGEQLLVQINRAGRADLTTGGRALSGPLGATLCVVDVGTGKVTPLPVGRPHTPPITGHECWVGMTGEVLFTAGHYAVSRSAFVTYGEAPEAERKMPSGAVWAIKPGEARARVVARGKLWNHLAASDDGRFFIGDDHLTGRIHIGSIATGCSLGLCDSQTRQGLCQHSHVHAYMTPDNGHVIFNSIVTGVAQVYAARVPEGFLDKVLSLKGDPVSGADGG